MMRVAIAAAWVWVALAGPASASAPSRTGACACIDNSVRASQPEAALDEVAHSAGVARANSSPADDAPIAWCLAPNDPRCSPRDAGAPSQTHELSPLQASPAWAVASAGPPVPCRRPRIQTFGTARGGVRSRVERPPRR